MSRLDDEIREIKSAADGEAQKECQRLLAAAERDAEKILERSRQEPKLRVAELSVKMAEERIRGEIAGAGRERIFSQFARTLGGEQ